MNIEKEGMKRGEVEVILAIDEGIVKSITSNLLV